MTRSSRCWSFTVVSPVEKWRLLSSLLWSDLWFFPLAYSSDCLRSPSVLQVDFFETLISSCNVATILPGLLDCGNLKSKGYKFYFRNYFLLSFYLAFLRMDSIVIFFFFIRAGIVLLFPDRERPCRGPSFKSHSSLLVSTMTVKSNQGCKAVQISQTPQDVH